MSYKAAVITISDKGYRGEREDTSGPNLVNILKEKGMDHAQLLSVCAPKPFCLIAGEFDNDDSWQLMKKASGYSKDDGRLKIINHATGHTPPRYALEEGYDFIERWI